MPDEGWEKLMGALRKGPTPREPRDGRPIVLFNTHWQRLADGWSIASRAYARAMMMAGIDVRLTQWDQASAGPIEPEVIEEIGREAMRYPREWDLHVFGAMFAGTDAMMPVLQELLANSGPQAYYCVFERLSIEPRWVPILNQLPIWVQCRMNERVLKEAGVKTVTHIPYPFFDDDPHQGLPPPKESKIFYFIGRFEPRKAPENLIKAFMTAFKPEEAGLIIKPGVIGDGSEDTPEQIIEKNLGRNGWTKSNWGDCIRIVRGHLSGEEMVQLHAWGDIYVSASRGEGLDLPMWAAKLAGRRIVTTASGGPEDFLGEEDIVVPASGLIDADPRYEWGEGAKYIDYELDDLVAAMQKARSEGPRGSRDWPTRSEHRAKAVGARLREWIESCQG